MGFYGLFDNDGCNNYFCMVDRVGVRFFETNVADVIGIMVAVHAGIWVTVSAGLIFNFMG